VFVPIEVAIPQEQYAGTGSLAPAFCRAGFARKFTCGWLTHGRLLWTRTIPGPRPSGSLRLSKFDPIEFVFARAKTILPGAKLGAHNAPRAQTRGSLEYSRWGCGTRRTRRGVEQPTSDWYAEVFSQSPWSSRAPREAEARARRGERGIASVRIRDRDVAYAHPLRRTRREGTGEAGADQGVPFLFVAFLWASKEKRPRVQGRSRPQLAFQSCAERTHK
jgi:hypothetical protein